MPSRDGRTISASGSDAVKVTAAAVEEAFARGDFSFSGYRERLLADPLIGQLVTRVWLARLAYLMKYPWLVRLGWRAMRVGIGLTRWRDPNYVPAIPPRLMPAQRR